MKAAACLASVRLLEDNYLRVVIINEQDGVTDEAMEVLKVIKKRSCPRALTDMQRGRRSITVDSMIASIEKRCHLRFQSHSVLSCRIIIDKNFFARRDQTKLKLNVSQCESKSLT
jgi:hypothetical protein